MAAGATLEPGKAAITALFGLVCPACDGFNEPGRTVCTICGTGLAGPARHDEKSDGAPPLVPVVSPDGRAPQPEGVPRPAGVEAVLGGPAVEDEASQDIASAVVQRIALGDAGAPLPSAAPPDDVPAAWDLRLVEAAASGPAIPAASPLIPASTPAGRDSPPETMATPSARAICASCGAENRPDDLFCASCQTPLPPSEATLARGREPLVPGRTSARVLRGERLGQVLPLGLNAAIGRGACDLSFPRDPFLAAVHCKLVFEEGRLRVRDAGTASGTLVRLFGQEPITPGECFSVGDHLLRFAGPLPPPMTGEDGTRLAGSPRPAAAAVRIEELHEGSVPGRTLVRRSATILLGRDESCDLAFPGDRFVSSRHCEVVVTPGGQAWLRDLGSTNGTFRKLPAGGERELFKGDCIRAGGEVLQLIGS